MLSLPRVSEFTYKGVKRVAIEKGPDARGHGLFCTQLVPEVGPRTFKPAKMMDVKQLGVAQSLYFLLRSARVEIG
jgi:hypothetical protein